MFLCGNCRTVFTSQYHLTRHLNRKVKCEAHSGSEAKHACQCGNRYTHPSSLSRHRASCAATPPAAAPPQLQVINHGVVQQLVQQYVVINAQGWPERWPYPQVSPEAFAPPTFTISLETLQAAVSACPAAAGACHRGEPNAVAALLVEIMKLVHANPRTRNIYLNPNRADQVLVFLPEQWETRRLIDAVQLLFGHVVGELSELPYDAAPTLKPYADGARTGFENCQQVVGQSCNAMAAHLNNMRQAALCEGSFGVPSDEVRVFGRERRGHLINENAAGALLSLEAALGAAGPNETPVAYAARAMMEYAALLRRRHPENLSVIALGGGVSTFTSNGWVPRDRAEAASEQIDTFAPYLQHCVSAPSSTLSHLCEALCEQREELKAALGCAILDRFTQAAADFYQACPAPMPGTRPTPQQQARALLQADQPSSLEKYLEELLG